MQRKALCHAAERCPFLSVENCFDGELRQGEDGELLSRKRAGEGIGLASVRAAVEHSGGKMQMKTTGRDGGYAFAVKVVQPLGPLG